MASHYSATGKVEGEQQVPPASPAAARWALVVLILLSFSLHLWRIEAKAIWWDESLSLYRAQRSLAYILSNRIDFPGASTVDLHPPLYFLLLHAFVRLCGESDLVLRMPSVAFATLIVPMLYTFACRLRGRRAGLWAALLGALSPFYLWYAQEARMYTMVTALGLASLYCLWRALARRNWGWGLASGLLITCAAATQYLSALLLGVEAVLVLLLWRRHGEAPLRTGQQPGRQRWWLWGGASLALVLGLLGLWVVRLASSPKAGREYVPLSVILPDALNSFSLGLSVDSADVWLFTLCFVAVFVLGVVSVSLRPPAPARESAELADWRVHWAGTALLAGYVLMPIAGMWLVSLFVPVYMNSRYLIMCSPGFYLGIAIGLDGAGRWRQSMPWVLGSVLIIAISISTGRYFTNEQYRTKEDYRSAALFIADNEQVGDAILVDAPENLTAFTHYYRGDLPVLGVPSVALSGDPGEERVTADLSELASRYERLWLVHCRAMFSDPLDRVPGWLGQNATLLRKIVYPSYGSDVTLSAYRTRSPLVPSVGPVPPSLGTFSGRLSLIGCNYRYLDGAGALHEGPGSDVPAGALMSAGMAAIPAGTMLTARLSWQPLGELSAYKTSLRLLDQRGITWVQVDEAPYERWPSDQWPVGGQIAQDANLRIPPATPPGTYWLQLWVYEAANGRSLPFRQRGLAADSACAVLGQVTVAKTFAGDNSVPAHLRHPRWASVFGRTVQLLAYGLGPQEVEAGDTVTLELYWRARRRPEADYKLLIHWEDATGRVWHADDAQLAGTDYPTSSWDEQELVRGIVRIPVPADAPPGRHRLHLLLRDTQTQRLLWLGQGIVPWTGHDLSVGEILVR